MSYYLLNVVGEFIAPDHSRVTTRAEAKAFPEWEDAVKYANELAVGWYVVGETDEGTTPPEMMRKRFPGNAQ